MLNQVKTASRAALHPLGVLALFAVLTSSACDARTPATAEVVPDSLGVVEPETDPTLSAGGDGAGLDTAGLAGDSTTAEPPPEDPVITPGPPVGPEDFRVDVAAVDPSLRVPRPDHVRALYINAWTAGSAARMASLIDLADRTEINAFVIDIKESDGQVTYRSTVPMVRTVGANQVTPIRDVRALLARLRAHGIYPIARIVVFKDPVLATARPDWSIRTADQRVWRDHNREMWVDPYNGNVWEYNIALAREAVALGFAEVQWDYVRFPDVPGAYMRTAVYAAQAGRTRAQAIREFLRYSGQQLDPYDVPVTADVFGVTTSASHDVGIGQHWESMADVADVLLPMVYPSHYPRGSFGIGHPNAQPYATVLEALRHGVRRNRAIDDAAIIRPWLQDFTLGQPPYSAAHVRAQIRAVYDAGLSEWVLWNASSRYSRGALADADGNVPYIEGLAALIAAPSDSVGDDEDLRADSARADSVRAAEAAKDSADTDVPTGKLPAEPAPLGTPARP